MTLPRRSRLYCGYNDNTNETTSIQNVWQQFPQSSTGWTIWRHEGQLAVDSDSCTFTWNGDKPCWFHITATCNIYKGTGGNANRNVETRWYLNDVGFGAIRGSYMNAQDSQIITGTGWIELQPGDTLKPYIRNIDNDDKILLKNCSFTFWEDSGY